MNRTRGKLPAGYPRAPPGVPHTLASVAMIVFFFVGWPVPKVAIAAGGALLLFVMAQGWPRFAGGFCPSAGAGAVIAGVLDRTTPHAGASLLPPLLALAGAAIAATIQAIAWEHAVRTGRRS